jgi:hypothetical protein
MEIVFPGKADEANTSAGKTDGDRSNPIIVIEWNSAVTVSSMFNARTDSGIASDPHSNSVVAIKQRKPNSICTSNVN